MKILLLSSRVDDEFTNLHYAFCATIGNRQRERYAKKWKGCHSKEIVLAPEELEGRHPFWCKIIVLIREMETGEWDYIFHQDTDSFITNLDKDIRDFLRGREELDFMATRDQNEFCIGDILLKCNEQSLYCLEETLRLGADKSCRKGIKYPEQYRFIQQAQKIGLKFHLFPMRQFSSHVTAWQRGDFIAHIIGKGLRVPADKESFAKRLVLENADLFFG